MVNGQASVDEQPVLQTNAATMKVALENKFCRSLPQLRVAEFVGFGVALTAVNRLAMPRVNLAADVAPTFYLVIHTTIIPHLLVTFVTRLQTSHKPRINLPNILLGVIPANLISYALPREQAHTAIINDLAS